MVKENTVGTGQGRDTGLEEDKHKDIEIETSQQKNLLQFKKLFGSQFPL